MLHLRMLGRLELQDDEGQDRLLALTQPKRLGLLLYLAAERPARWHRRDTLAALFWPELQAAGARAALRQGLHYLRQHLGAAVIAVRGEEDVGLSDGEIETDLSQFERALAAGQWESAAALATGSLVPGYHCAGASSEFSEWLDQRRRQVRRQAVRAARAQARGAPAPDLTQALEHFRFGLDQGSFDEGVLRELMQALAQDDNRGAALSLYRDFAERMRRNLEAEPSPASAALAEAIRRAGGGMAPAG
ncbi:MAG: BTAD domain-containing putative transcriptional regulator [Gemmatimonadota bacterium]|nr:BTAD domain-containing putative transcriptional regulator [Gemmatimonadota bacterium]